MIYDVLSLMLVYCMVIKPVPNLLLLSQHSSGKGITITPEKIDTAAIAFKTDEFNLFFGLCGVNQLLHFE